MSLLNVRGWDTWGRLTYLHWCGTVSLSLPPVLACCCCLGKKMTRSPNSPVFYSLPTLSRPTLRPPTHLLAPSLYCCYSFSSSFSSCLCPFLLIDIFYWARSFHVLLSAVSWLFVYCTTAEWISLDCYKKHNSRDNVTYYGVLRGEFKIIVIKVRSQELVWRVKMAL